MPPPIQIDHAKRALRYPCACGRTILIPVANLIADEWLDPCGCGEATILFTPEQVAEYRREMDPGTSATS
jgi:hypothetical protein